MGVGQIINVFENLKQHDCLYVFPCYRYRRFSDDITEFAYLDLSCDCTCVIADNLLYLRNLLRKTHHVCKGMTGIAAVVFSLVAEILELGYCICIGSIRHTGHGLPGKIINSIHITAEVAFIYQFLHLLAKVVILNIEFKVLQENGFSRLVVLFDIVQQHYSASLIILINFADNIQHKIFIDKCFSNQGKQVDGGFIPDLVIIDTQARFTEGDENKQIDADSYINAFNSLAAIFNSNIMVVHHTSKSNGETLKGSVNFKGASDMDVRISKFGDAGVKISHEKNKDGEELKGKLLRLETVNVGMSDVGDIITSLVLTDRNLDNLPSESTEAKSQMTEDLVLLRDFWENNARQDGDRWVFNRLDCIEYLKSDCGWTHKKAVQETHAPNKGLFSRLKENRIIINPEPVGNAPVRSGINQPRLN